MTKCGKKRMQHYDNTFFSDEGNIVSHKCSTKVVFTATIAMIKAKCSIINLSVS